MYNHYKSSLLVVAILLNFMTIFLHLKTHWQSQCLLKSASNNQLQAHLCPICYPCNIFLFDKNIASGTVATSGPNWEYLHYLLRKCVCFIMYQIYFYKIDYPPLASVQSFIHIFMMFAICIQPFIEIHGLNPVDICTKSLKDQNGENGVFRRLKICSSQMLHLHLQGSCIAFPDSC